MPMTSRQRIITALAHTEPDRTPMFEYVLLSPLADIFLGHLYGGDPDNWERLVHELGWEAAVRRNAADRVALAQFLGHDMLYLTPTSPPPSKTPPAPLPPSGSDPVENLQCRNERETASPGVDERTLLVYRYVQEELQRREMDLPLLAPAYVHGVWTDVDLMQTMALAPEVAHEHFALATRFAMDYIDHYTALGIEQIGIGGDFSGTRPLISPRMYRAFIVPHLHRLSERIHAAGAYAINASDGDLWPVIDDFLVASGVDGYLEIDLHAGMDLRRLKAAYGDRITFYGNLDCGIELSFGTPEAVRQHTLDCLDSGWGRGGHILCASNAITASIPPANYLAAVNAYREVFALDPLRFP
jgi:hypothetical protein